MQIHDVPETISREAVLKLFRDLGFDPNSMRGAEFGIDGVWVEVIAPPKRLEGDTVACHRVYVRFVD